GQLVHAVFVSANPSVANQDLVYEYDAAGNRVRTIVNGVTTSYQANDLNQYTTISTASQRYDADGNLIADGASTMTYDDENRLIAVAGPDGSWTYKYDVFGNLAASVHAGQRTTYLIDPTGLGNVAAEYGAAGSLQARYVHAASTLVSRVDAAGAAA